MYTTRILKYLGLLLMYPRCLKMNTSRISFSFSFGVVLTDRKLNAHRSLYDSTRCKIGEHFILLFIFL